MILLIFKCYNFIKNMQENNQSDVFHKTVEKYTDSEKYQDEIKKQYEKRIPKFSREQVLDALRVLDVPNLPTIDDFSEAGHGYVNATYITPKLAIKINQNPKHPDYLANKIASDRLGENAPVVKVIAYDFFKKTPFEVLVMERSEGKMLLEDVLEMSEEERAAIFQQVLDVVGQLLEIKFKDFGWVNLDGQESYATYSEFLVKEFDEYVSEIREEKLCAPEDIAKIEAYFKKHVGIFDDGESVFVHADTHMGNILHEGDKMTALLDFDYSLKAPKERALISLFGFIDSPQQFVEGTKDFSRFKGKNFYHLAPLLKEKFLEILADPQLARKLNIIGIKDGIMWVSQNWSADWNAEMIRNMIKDELAEDDLSRTYYGGILAKLR